MKIKDQKILIMGNLAVILSDHGAKALASLEDTPEWAWVEKEIKRNLEMTIPKLLLKVNTCFCYLEAGVRKGRKYSNKEFQDLNKKVLLRILEILMYGYSIPVLNLEMR